MAEIDDLKKRIEELEKEKTSRRTSEEVNAVAEATRRAAMSAEDLSKATKAGAQNYEEINNNIKTIANNKKIIIDYEQIEEELNEKKLNALKEQFRINQQTLLQLLEQKKVEGNNEVLNEKIELLQKVLEEQGKQIQNANKEKEIKEKILSIGKETLQGAKQYGGELEKHIIQLNVLNGGVQDYNSSIREGNRLMYASSVGTGLSIEELNKASQSLSQTMIGLSTQTDNSIKDMGNAVAQLGKLGVDAATASKGFDSLVTAMGKTPQQAVKIQDSFIQMAAKNRLALGSVTQAFAENSSRFIGFGEQMTKVLTGLSEQALKTGIAIGNLVKIASGFDTFEDASRKVGNLNALLGGDYFNSIELLTATDEERIRLLKEGVAASGMQWSSMNRFQQMAIANAAGISDLNEAAKLFGQTSLQNTRQQAEGAEVQKTLAEQAQSATLAMDKLKSSFNGLILILEPIVTVLMEVVGGFSKFVQGMNDVFSNGGKWPIFGAIATSTILYVMYSVIRLRGAFGLLIKTIGSGIVSAAKRAAAAILGIPKPPPVPAGPVGPVGPVGPAGPGRFMSFINTIQPGKLLAAAAALVLVAAALFIMAKALQEFATVASGDSAGGAIGLAVGSLVSLVGALMLMNKVQGEVIKGSIIVGIMALVLLGFGIALSKFINIDWKIIAGIGIILVALTLAILGIGLALSGPQALLFKAGIIVIGVMAVTLGLLGFALSAIVKSIESASPAITNLANSFKALFELKDLKDNFSSLESFLSQLSNIDIEPINNLANAIYNLATNLEALAAIPSNMGVNVTGTADLNSVIDETVANTAKATNVVSKAASSAAAQTLIPAQQTTAFVPLVVQIDKKTIIEILKEDIANISKGQALDAMDAIGLAQSGLFSMDRISVGNNK